MGCCCGSERTLKFNVRTLEQSAKVNNEKGNPPTKESDVKLEPENTFRNKRGFNMYYRCWSIRNPSKIAFIIHGLSDHINRYERLANLLNELGFIVFGMDQQGHGRSDGPTAFATSLGPLVEDYIEFIQFIETNVYPFRKPALIIGHSMGGLVASLLARVCYKERKEEKSDEKMEPVENEIMWHINGVLLSAPAIKPNPETATPCLLRIVKCFATCCPTMGVGDDLDIKTLTHDEDQQKKNREDKYIYHGKVKVGMAYSLLEAMDELGTKMDKITYPFLILQGTGDRSVYPPGADFFYEKAASSDKTIKKYKDLYHELLLEKDNDVIYSDIISWVKQHFK